MGKAVWAMAGAALLLATGAAAATDAWRSYSNPAMGFTIDVPVEPQLENSTTPTAAGDAKVLTGSMDLGDAGALVFSVGDASALNLSIDADTGLEKAVQGELGGGKLTLDSETKITVAGDQGREIIMHADGLVARSRLIVRGKRIYTLIGVGPTASGVPAEYARFESSLVITP